MINLELSHTCLIHYLGGRLRAAEIASSGSMTFTLSMDKDLSWLTAGLSGWVNLLVLLVGSDYPSLGVWFNILQDSSRNGIFDDPIGFLLGSELDWLLGDLLDSDTWPPVGLKLILDIQLGSRVICPDLVGSPLWVTHPVHLSGSCSKLLKLPLVCDLLISHDPRLMWPPLGRDLPPPSGMEKVGSTTNQKLITN